MIRFDESRYSDKWLDHFRRHAEAAAESAKDATKIGAALIGTDREVLLTAFNGPGLGVTDTPERRNKRPMKYNFACHAEQNLVAFSARNGIKVKGKSVYTTHFPCANCANTLIQAGISAIIVKDGESGNTTMIDDASYSDAALSFQEAGIKLYTHEVCKKTEEEKTLARLHIDSNIIGRGSDFDHLNELSYLIPKEYRRDFWCDMRASFKEEAPILQKKINKNDVVEPTVKNAWIIAALFSEDALVQNFEDVGAQQEAARRAYRFIREVDVRSSKTLYLRKRGPVVIPKYSFSVW